MAKAWIEYDDAGQPTAVKWNSSGGRKIEITTEMAGSFMDGSEDIHLYHVEESDGTMILKKRDDQQKEPVKFWSLDTLGESDGISMSLVDKYGMTITLNGDRSLFILYATIKNDPSWLVRSWNLTKIAPSGGSVRIDWADADKHSFYVGGYR